MARNYRRYVVDGKTYASTEEMPEEARKKWNTLSAMAGSLSDKARGLHAGSSKSTWHVETTAFEKDGRLASPFWLLQGLLSSLAFSVLAVVLPLTLFFGDVQSPQDQLLMAAAMGPFVLPCWAFLNMANLFSRLRRANPELYALETRGRGFVRHVGWSGRSVFSVLHDTLLRIAAEDNRLPNGMHTYAVATVRFNRFVFWCVVVLVAALLGFAAFQVIRAR